MEQSPFRKSDSASQEIPLVLWKPKLHYRVHKAPTLKPTLSQMHSVHPLSLRSILISLSIYD
jgi:hypothetical protein